ncbi:MAG TPA: hypothetical protein VM534_06665 [Thermoanaerobaculia bacterium]|nr:hypothetical protein [Thermoanaerobaculia bacterium]
MKLSLLSSMLLSILLSMLLSIVHLSAQPVRNGPLPGPLPLFPPDNWWNVDVSEAPVDPASASFIEFIGTSRALHPDLGGDTGMDEPLTYGMIYIVVPGSQPLVPVSFDYADESDYAAPGRPPGYPIPEEAKSQTRWIEGGMPGNDLDTGGDRHMLIVDRDRRILYELFDVDWESSHWRAGSGAIFPLDSNLRRPDGWTSADAAGLAILPGLIRYDEVYGDEPILHAFRFTVRATNGYVYPASHRAGSTSGALPMGARLRLKAGKDISGYPAPVHRIFQAMKTYGLIVADNGSDMYITGTYDTRWDNDLLNPAFRSLKASDFEVIELGWQPEDEPPCIAPTIAQQPQDLTVSLGNGATLSVAVSGTSPFSYQWYEGLPGERDRPVADADQSTLVVFPARTTRYWVRANGVCGTVDSDGATVTVQPVRSRAARR